MFGDFTTSRLQAEPWRDILQDDQRRGTLLQELGEILDDQVTAFLPESLWFTPGQTDVGEWAKTFSQGTSEISSIRVISSGNDAPLAGVLLLRPESPSDLHIGYIFGQQHWGKGYATELLRGLVSSLTKGGYKALVHAGVVQGNPASARVLIKVGFAQGDDDGASGKHKQADDVDWFLMNFR